LGRAVKTQPQGQCAAAELASPAIGQGKLGITLRMYNYGVSRGLLSRAEGEATAILQQAGIEAAWVDCPLTEAEWENYPACQNAPSPTDFSVKILTTAKADRFSSHHEALGQALECPRGQMGCSAYVFYRNVTALARDGDAGEYQLLGHALAHEIGHLLLGPNSHSATGIMRGNWNHQDLQSIARSYLFFTEQQSKQMRNEVSARDSNRRDQMTTAAKQ